MLEFIQQEFEANQKASEDFRHSIEEKQGNI